MKNSVKGMNLSYLSILSVLILIASEVCAAENLQQNKVTIKTKRLQTVVKISEPRKTDQVSNLKSNTNAATKKPYQAQIGPPKPLENISNQQGRPVRQYNVSQGSAKPIASERTMTPASEVQLKGVRAWKLDASGNRVEVQGALRVIEGPVR